MKLVCCGLTSDNAMGKSRITGMYFSVKLEGLEDEVIVQFIKDNPKGIEFHIAECTWVLGECKSTLLAND